MSRIMRLSSWKQMHELLIRFRDKYLRYYDVAKAHIEATKEVAESSRIENPTIRDLCFRRLNLDSIDKFRDLLEKWIMQEHEPLKSILIKHTLPVVHDEIEQFFKQNKFLGIQKATVRDISLKRLNIKRLNAVKENFSFQLEPDIAKELKVLSVMEETSTSDLLAKLVPKVVEQRYIEWLRKQH